MQFFKFLFLLNDIRCLLLLLIVSYKLQSTIIELYVGTTKTLWSLQVHFILSRSIRIYRCEKSIAYYNNIQSSTQTTSTFLSLLMISVHWSSTNSRKLVAFG